MKRRATPSSLSPPESQSQSLEFSLGDSSASQHSLGEQGATALIAMEGLGIGNDTTTTQEVAIYVPQQTGEAGQSSTQIISGIPSLVVEGIIIKDELGVVYSLPNYTYSYSSGNTSQAKQVDKALIKAVQQINKVPEHFASRFKSVVGDYTGFIPTVVGGISKKYKTKKIPTNKGKQENSVEEMGAKRSSKRKKG